MVSYWKIIIVWMGRGGQGTDKPRHTPALHSTVVYCVSPCYNEAFTQEITPMAKKRRSIQKKIVIALLVVGFLPGFVGVFFTYLSGTKALKDCIGANFQTIAIETSEKIDLIIQEKIRNAQTLAISPPIISAVKGARTREEDSGLLHYLQRFQKGEEGIVSIAVMDEKGGT